MEDGRVRTIPEDRNANRNVGKYESDQEDDGKLPMRREVDAQERAEAGSRASVGSFSDLVLEEYEKMNIDPLVGAQSNERDEVPSTPTAR